MLKQKSAAPAAGDQFPLSKFHLASVLGNILWHELQLCYGFVRRDLGTGLLPVPGFTLASLLYRKASAEEIYRVIPCTWTCLQLMTHCPQY
jgi:hypothetical protein